MTLNITKGMGGRKVEAIGTYAANEIDKMEKDFAKWKKSKAAQKKYCIQWYDRVLFNGKKRQLVIDFGDYSYFGLLKANKKEWEALMANKNAQKPVKLEV